MLEICNPIFYSDKKVWCSQNLRLRDATDNTKKNRNKITLLHLNYFSDNLSVFNSSTFFQMVHLMFLLILTCMDVLLYELKDMNMFLKVDAQKRVIHLIGISGEVILTANLQVTKAQCVLAVKLHPIIRKVCRH